jgi:hypothetical protein
LRNLNPQTGSSDHKMRPVEVSEHHLPQAPLPRERLSPSALSYLILVNVDGSFRPIADEVDDSCSTGVECAIVQLLSTARKGTTQ